MLGQVQAQKQQHTVLPQQIELLNFFHLNALELEQRIRDELDENPLLEEMANDDGDLPEKQQKEAVQDFQNLEEYCYDDIPDYKTEYQNYLPTDHVPEKSFAEEMDMRAELKKQFAFVHSDPRRLRLADFLIDSLNDHGYLEQDLQGLADEITFKTGETVDPKELDAVRRDIQLLDPPGAGSQTLKEYLLIQLADMRGTHPLAEKAIALLEQFFEELKNLHSDKIKKKLRLSDECFRDILQLIAGLQTKPINETGGGIEANQNVLPDFVITINNDEPEVSLYRQRSANLHISKAWMEIVQEAEQGSEGKANRQYLRNKLMSAQWFVSAIRQREENMLRIMRTIIEFQHDYFLYGDEMQIKPMVLKNVADKVGLDISTISRITCNKYAETPFGYLLLKDLFTEGITNETGTVISNRVLQTTLKEVVETEDKKKPYTDQQLVAILAERGYKVARRTIAKYREFLNIPTAQLRGLWA